MKKRKKAKKPASPKSVWRNHTKPIIIVAVILIIFSAILLLAYDPLIAGNEVSGTLQSEYRETLRGYVTTRFTVKIEDGRQIDIAAGRMGAFQKGRTVVLQEMNGLIFNRKEYRFVRYAGP